MLSAFKTKKDTPIVICGSGHGAEAVVRSFLKDSRPIKVHSDDPKVLKLLRQQDQITNQISGLRDQVIICAGYLNIISKKILSSNIVLNIHPSLLPKYRGRHSLAWALLNGEKTVGFTIHVMTEQMDAGDIIRQFKVSNQGQPVGDIWKQIHRLTEEKLLETVYKFLNNKIIPFSQNEDEATFFRARNRKDCFLHFDQTNDEIFRFFQVMSDPYPLPQINLKGEDLSIGSYEFSESYVDRKCGTVINTDKYSIHVKTLDGMIKISSIYMNDGTKVVDCRRCVEIGDLL